MNYTDISDIDNIHQWISEAIALKKKPYQFENLGKRKTLAMLFFNPSLRTRMSTWKAATNLGMDVLIMNFNNEVWAIEFEDGSIMNGSTSEHIKEAAAVISQYCDIIALRSFPTLTDKEKDLSEHVLSNFKKYASVPILNMESATAHPLQSLADAITISEHISKKRPKVVLSWAPHPKALPHAVANSFVKMMQQLDVNLWITNPKGYNLSTEIVKNTPITHSQEEAFKDADVIYCKNWSSYESYGKVICTDEKWKITKIQMQLTNQARFMHCLPVRRNVVVADEVLDDPSSLVIEQANNRTFSAQIALKKILENAQ